jgi:hypothetical protein
MIVADTERWLILEATPRAASFADFRLVYQNNGGPKSFNGG